MIPRKPYLLRAMVEWAEDNGMTPLIVVDATISGVRVPTAYVENGRITLNVSFGAMNQRQLGNELVTGNARFGGRSEYLEIPLEAVTAMVVRETGEGMMFPDEPPSEADDERLPDSGVSDAAPAGLSVVRSETADAGDGDGPDEPPPPPRGKPQLKLVK